MTASTCSGLRTSEESPCFAANAPANTPNAGSVASPAITSRRSGDATPESAASSASPAPFFRAFHFAHRARATVQRPAPG